MGDPQEGGRQAVGNMLLAGIAGLAGLAAASEGNTRPLFLDQQSLDPSSNEGTTGTARSGLFEFPCAVPSPNGPPPEQPVVGLVSSPDMKLDDDEQHLGNGSASILQPDPTSRPGGDAGPGISGKAPDGPFPEDSGGTGEPTSIEDGKLPSVTKSGTDDKAEPSSEEILGDSLLPDNMGEDVPRAWSPGGTGGATIQGVEGTKQARRSYVLYYAAVAGAILVLLALLATIAVHVAGRREFTGAQTAPSPVVIKEHDEEAPTCSGLGDHCASHPEGADNNNPADNPAYSASASDGSPPKADIPLHVHHRKMPWGLFYLGPRTAGCAAAAARHHGIVAVDNPAFSASGSEGSPTGADIPTRADHEAPGPL